MRRSDFESGRPLPAGPDSDSISGAKKDSPDPLDSTSPPHNSKPGLVPEYAKLARQGLAQLGASLTACRALHEKTLNRWLAVQKGFEPGELAKKVQGI